jgi:hypothetical protein
MKRLLTLLAVLLAFSTTPLWAADYIVIRISSDIALPVSVNTSDGTYTLKSYEVHIEGNITVHSAYDANGNQIMIQGSTSGGTNQATVRYYDLTQLYPHSQNTTSSSTSSNYNHNHTRNNPIDNFTNAAIDMMFVNGDGVPYFGVEVGYSHFCSNFVRARAALGESGGFLLYGGVGKEGIFKKDGPDDLYWHIGMGTYMTDDVNTIEMGITFGTNPMCNNTSWDSDINGGWGFVMDARYGFFIPDTRFGITAGAGVGVGFPESGQAKLIGEYQIGLVIKLFTD